MGGDRKTDVTIEEICVQYYDTRLLPDDPEHWKVVFYNLTQDADGIGKKMDRIILRNEIIALSAGVFPKHNLTLVSEL